MVYLIAAALPIQFCAMTPVLQHTYSQPSRRSSVRPIFVCIFHYGPRISSCVAAAREADSLEGEEM